MSILQSGALLIPAPLLRNRVSKGIGRWAGDLPDRVSVASAGWRDAKFVAQQLRERRRHRRELIRLFRNAG